MGLNQKEREQIRDALMSFARQHGNPDDHHSAKLRVERELQSICLIVNWILYKLSLKPNGSAHIETTGWRHRFAAFLRHPLFAAIILAFVIPNYTLEIARQRNVTLKMERVIGAAILAQPTGTKPSIDESGITITFGASDGNTQSVTLPHGLSKEDYEKLKKEW